jgi:histidine ammonia-lyase
MFLTEHGGLENGFMMVQYTAAALAAENKVLCHPASADSIPSSANVEDHVSFGATAARQAQQILSHVETIVAVELLTAAQGVDFRRRMTGQPAAKLGQGTAAAYTLIREYVPFIERDAIMAPHIEAVRKLVAEGRIKDVVESATGSE